MIPVQAKPEPADFNDIVRLPGLAWIASKAIDPNQPVPRGMKIKTYWRDCLDELHREYAGVCAYAAIYVERVTGGTSADHFVAKSSNLALAYEWSNYRLACLTMNARKRDFEDVLDPFSLASDTFRLELVTGAIYPNPSLGPNEKREAQDTINRLHLDSQNFRETRARHYQECRQNEYNSTFLKKRSPFVWYEANRQGVL